MAKVKILQKNTPILREIAEPVPLRDIKSPKIRKIIENMKEALYAEEDGVAIAAPQIGESLRIFIVSGKINALGKKREKAPEEQNFDDLVYINPEITKLSKKKSKVEEGCLSVRWLYGQVKRSDKVTIKAYDQEGKKVERGASGLLAQIFQHEIDHLEGVLFIDKAENIQNIPPKMKARFVFFGSSKFSSYVLKELELMGYTPLLNVDSTKSIPTISDLKKLKADVFVVASFGKILPKELIDMPKHKTLNVHPSLLPKLRGPSPIQNSILELVEPGVTIMRMDEKMDHGPIIARAKVVIDPWPDHYSTVEEKLGQAGGQILSLILPKWVEGKMLEKPQEHEEATFTKFIKKEDGLIDLNGPAEENLRKVLAYSTWPRAYIMFKRKNGKEIKVIIKDAQLENCTNENSLKTENCKLKILSVIPAGKKEMTWEAFLRGH